MYCPSVLSVVLTFIPPIQSPTFTRTPPKTGSLESSSSGKALRWNIIDSLAMSVKLKACGDRHAVKPGSTVHVHGPPVYGQNLQEGESKGTKSKGLRRSLFLHPFDLVPFAAHGGLNGCRAPGAMTHSQINK